MKTIQERLVINLEEVDTLFVANIELPKWVAEDLANEGRYIAGFDGHKLTATSDNEGDAIKNVLSRLQVNGFTGRAKLNKVSKQVFEVQVKNWMLKPATEDFDFHAKWNNNVPMPMAIMEGTILEETKGMYKMELKGSAEPSTYCRVCGAKLTNKVSLLYGVGPECSSKIGLPRIASEEELQTNFEKMKEIADNVIWEGWIIKKAIKEMNEVIEGEAE